MKHVVNRVEIPTTNMHSVKHSYSTNPGGSQFQVMDMNNSGTLTKGEF